MAEDREPAAGGMTWREAYDRYADPEKLKILREAAGSITNRPSVVGRPGARRLDWRKSAEPGKKKLADAARKEMNRAFRALLKRGELVAWATQGTPVGPRVEIPAEAWPYLRILNKTTFVTPENTKLYSVKFYVSEAIAEKPGTADAGPVPLVPWRPKETVLPRVVKIWESLPEDTRKRVNKHGGQTAVGDEICSRLPDLKPETVHREFRRVLMFERMAKSGKKAG